MLAQTTLTFDNHSGLWIATGLGLAAFVIELVRRPTIPRLSLAMAGVALVLLALAAGEPVWSQPSSQQVTVMVDLSPSTRTADYRDRRALERRIHELLRDVPYRLQFFAAGIQQADSTTERLADLPADHTTYTPPVAPATLLFSDCRFPLPQTASPTYVVVDAGLEEPEDAAVTGLEIREEEVAVSVKNAGGKRTLAINGNAATSAMTVPSGSVIISRPLRDGASGVAAELSPGDPWPENDALTTVVPPPEQYKRWWVGAPGPGSNWRTFAPADLPTDPAAYLAPAVIVLANVAASDLSEVQQQRLIQYVRDLGGGIVLLGGDHAFAAGGYEGTSIDSLSPLASDPPLPTNHWILLVDGSGSMSTGAVGSTRWKFATDAVARLLPHLPAEDVASVGSFSQSLQWWVEGKPVREAATLPLPPSTAYPHGPTNLQPAIESIARSADGKMPVQLLVVSDFDTEITGGPQLSALLKSRDVHLHLLAIGEGTALAALQRVAADTGGTVVSQLDPTRWATAARELARAAGSKLLERDPITVTFLGGAGAPVQTAGPWNRVWLKDSAVKIAEARRGTEIFPMSARWNAGEGRVIAAAFGASGGAIDRLSQLASRPPRDPRFRLTWAAGPMLRVVVDAARDHRYFNGQELTLELTDGATSPAADRGPIPQSGPGRYDLAVPAPRSPILATVRASGQVVGRVAVAGRYAPEFEAIGNDRVAMRELARRSGGEVVPPTRATPLDIHWPPRTVPLTSPLAAAGAALVALGLIWWRLR